MPTEPHAGIYARVSSDRDGAALGVGRQVADCRRICQERGWKPVEYVDNDLTAADPNVLRPQYQALLAAVKNGDLIAVVAWDLDRLTRQPRELEEFLHVADGAGLHNLVTVVDAVDPVTGDGLLVARIKGAVAAEEVAKTRRRLIRAKADKASKGEWNGGPLPFGRGLGMIIKNREAAILREAAERVLAGESFRSVAFDLSDRDLGPAPGRRWSGGSNLALRLTAPHVAGLRRHHNDLIVGTWEPILAREMWERLRALRADPTRRTRVGAPARQLLSGGILRCGRCGSPLRARPRADGTRRYGCPPEGNHGYGCGGVARRADEVDVYVTEAVLTRLERSDIPFADEAADVDSLVSEMELLDSKLAFFAEEFALDRVTRVEWGAATDALRDRRRRVESSLASTRQASGAAAVAGIGVRDRWLDLSMDQQRDVIRELLPDGVVLRSPGRGNWRVPLGAELVDLAWFDSTPEQCS